MSALFPLFDFLEELSRQPGTTDITMVSDGRVAVRRNARIAVTRVEALGCLWERTMDAHFPAARDGRRRGAARVISSGNRRYRATLAEHRGGASLSVRPLRERPGSPAELRLPDGLAEFFLGLNGGLVLVAGPTGSGKSTTVASLLASRRDGMGGKIVTIEDPVEFLHSDDERTLFIQRELGTSVAGYSEGLEEALQMNPDVIAVQEVREREAAETALSAALSGHLVIASVHAFTGATVPQRYLSVIDPGLEDHGARDSLAACLEAVVFQRLLPGFDGLVPVFEVLYFRHRGERLPSMERLVRQGNWVGLRQELAEGRRYGMIEWEECLRERVACGLLPAVS